MINNYLKHNNELINKFLPLGILLFVYFLCRLFFQQITIMKVGFIFPTGLIVEMFYGAGEFVAKEWLFGIENTQFILGESCSGTTFFSLLFAYIIYRVKTQDTSYIWLFLSYPITIVANAMRVLSSIYAHNTLSIFKLSEFSDEVHVITGVITFLCSFLIVILLIDNTNYRAEV